FPRVSITIEPADSPDAVRLLEENKVDLALRIGVKPPGHIHERPLFTDELSFLVSPQHPWAIERRANLAELDAQNLILHSKRTETFKLVMDYFESLGHTPHNVMELGSVAAIKELAKINLGVAVLAGWVAADEIAAGALISLPLGRRKLKRRWRLAWLKGRRLTINEETFIGLCEASAENMILNGQLASSVD